MILGVEQFNSDPDGENSDANIFGLQAGVKFASIGGERCWPPTITLAVRARTTLRSHNNANGNTTYRVGTVNMLQYGYDILDLSAQ